MSDVERVLCRVAPDSPPTAIERPAQGNHKETAVARYADGPSLVVQLSSDPSATDTEAALLRAVADRTSVPVPRLVAHGHVDGRGYLITEHVEGTNLHERFVDLEPSRRQSLANEFGVVLASLHEAFAFDSAGPLSVDGTGELAAAGWTAAQAFQSTVESGLTALPTVFDDLRPRLEAALGPPPTTGRPRLFPWDLRPGNAILAEDRLAAVVDWGAPRAADPALSVAKTEHLVCRWYGTDPDPLTSAFREGYRSVRPLPDVPVAARLAAVVDAAVDSRGTVTRPHYPERTGSDAVAIHREWLAERLAASETE